ncbi:hypothetical protein BA190_29665 [Labrys sp. WJW]|uniref:DMT family transporter n=1 Tax=Labrys sp. WJW TaxID=1737983 RepID=UPI000834F112|nr:DMT family transporter [Labrys sp. WJW]OCC01281.1 hypothetical protein BA190_29665 [Labrys sp. WJW]
MIAILAALAASCTWACASLVSHAPARHLGAFAFARIQLPTSALLLVVIATMVGGWPTIEVGNWSIFLISGFVGILMGDIALFNCLRKGGPRRMQLLFALNAPLAAVLGYVWLSESLNFRSILGMVLVLGGVVIAILHNRKADTENDLDELRGSLFSVIAWGLLAALCQAIGLIAVKPILSAGANPFAVSALRTLAAAILILAAARLKERRQPSEAPAMRWVAQTVIAGWLGYGLAMTLLLIALGRFETGIVATLGATVPVMMLPLIWIRTGRRPSMPAWVGALIVVAGTARILIRS